MAPRVLPNPIVKHEQVALIAAPEPTCDSADTPKRSARFDDRINPRWLRIPTATKYSGINRNRLYRLIAEGAIKTASLKEHRGAKRGLRLIDRFSLDLYLEKLSKPVKEQLVAESNELLVQEEELARQQELLAQKQRSLRERLARIRQGKGGVNE